MNTMKTTMVSRRYQMVMLVGEGNVIIILHDEDGHKMNDDECDGNEKIRAS